MEVMVSTYERRRFQTEVINELPLYPTEAVLWDENQVPDVHYTGVMSHSPLYSSCCEGFAREAVSHGWVTSHVHGSVCCVYSGGAFWCLAG